MSDWAGDRPDEPQMPLYSVTHDEAVAAVAFARLKRGKDFGFAGLAESAGILPGSRLLNKTVARQDLFSSATSRQPIPRLTGQDC